MFEYKLPINTSRDFYKDIGKYRKKYHAYGAPGGLSWLSV